jgi:hypothetical protein
VRGTGIGNVIKDRTCDGKWAYQRNSLKTIFQQDRELPKIDGVADRISPVQRIGLHAESKWEPQFCSGAGQPTM